MLVDEILDALRERFDVEVSLEVVREENVFFNVPRERGRAGMSRVEIFTDGACGRAPAPVLGAILRFGEATRAQWRGGRDHQQSHGAAAAIEALNALTRPATGRPRTVYVEDGITAWIDGWKPRLEEFEERAGQERRFVEGAG